MVGVWGLDRETGDVGRVETLVRGGVGLRW